jgi:NAD(P)-dependent dehydrogenase (short-subunit alcohol dehydrogenase family)
MAQLNDMAGKVILVTGGGSGIGLGTAICFAQEGARVAIAVRKPADEALSKIRAAGGEAIQVLADVSKQADVERMIQEVVKHWGRLDALVNNAGIEGHHAKLADQEVNVLAQVLEVNVQGVFLTMQAAIKQFLAQNDGGAIVNIASGFSFVGFPESSPYAASKGAVMALTRSAALEYARQGIRINAVCPMDINTPMTAKSLSELPGGAEAYAASRVTGRMGEPQEVGAAVVFLCSSKASFIIGSALMVDGGYIAQ